MLQNAVDQQMIPANELSGILASLTDMRGALVSADALRSFIIIAIGCVLLWLYATGKLRKSFTIAGIALLCLGICGPSTNVISMMTSLYPVPFGQKHLTRQKLMN